MFLNIFSVCAVSILVRYHVCGVCSYPQYILKHLDNLPIKPDAREQRSVCLAYLNYLMAVYQFKAADLKRKGKL